MPANQWLGVHMHPVIRKPLTQWFYTVLTGGIYLFYWVWRVSSELNNAEGKVVLNISLWKKIFPALLILTMAAFIYAAKKNSIIPSLIMFASYLVFVIYVLCAIGNYIKIKDKENNLGIYFSNLTSIFLLFVVANTGVIYMQRALNQIIASEQNGS